MKLLIFLLLCITMSILVIQGTSAKKNSRLIQKRWAPPPHDSDPPKNEGKKKMEDKMGEMDKERSDSKDKIKDEKKNSGFEHKSHSKVDKESEGCSCSKGKQTNDSDEPKPGKEDKGGWAEKRSAWDKKSHM